MSETGLETDPSIAEGGTGAGPARAGAVSSPGEEEVGRRVAIPLLAATGILLTWWGWKQGAYFGPVLYPGAAALYLLIALVLWLAPARGPIGGAVGLALGAAFGLGAWTLASILWTPVQAAAVADAQRVFAYAAVFLAGILTTRLLGRGMIRALASVAIAATVVGIATVATITFGSDLATYLHDDATLRLPVGYRNANAAFFLIGVWPLIGVAARNEVRWEIRALSVAAATMLLELAVLAQSRGSLPAAAVALLVYLALSGSRLRAASVIGLAALPVLPALPALLDVYRHGNADAGVATLLHDAGRAIGFTSLLSFALAALALRIVHPRLRLGASGVRLLSRVAAAVAILVVLTGGSLFIARHGGPFGFVDQRVDEFSKIGYPDLRGQGIRYGANVGSNRRDFWRVGLDQGADHLALGGGAGSFQLAYLKQRRSSETPRDPHSIEIRLLSELGLPGLSLFVAFVVASLVASLRARRVGPVGATLVAAGAAGGVQCLFQGSYDWFWQYPGVMAPGFYLLGVAVAPSVGRLAGPRIGWMRAAAASVLVALALIAVPLFLADRYSQRGLDEVGRNPTQALSDLQRAADLNPFDSQPLLYRGAISSELGRHRPALEAFRQAAEREPEDYAVHWFIARELLRSNPARARAELNRASQLNPLGPEIAQLRRRLKAGSNSD